MLDSPDLSAYLLFYITVVYCVFLSFLSFITYASESTLRSCLNVKELLARSK